MKQQKIISALTLVPFLAVIFGLGAGLWLLPKKSFSADENRLLQAFPTITLQALTDGELSEDFNAYYADHLPLRRGLIGINASASLALGRGESNGVLASKEGQLAVRKFNAYISLTERARDTDYFDPDHIVRGVEALGYMARSADLPLTYLPAPRTVDVVTSAFAYPSALSDELRQTLMTAADTAGVDTLDLTPALRAAHDRGEYVYYRTDHHWTTLGAYKAYTALMTLWGMADEILPTEAFTVRRVEDFYGTTWSRAGLFGQIPPDTLELWEMPDDKTFALRDKDGRLIQNGFIDESFLAAKDKYGAFLSGTRQVLTISQEGADAAPTKPRLLIARDSFASALAPFLARHFDLVLVNLSGGMTHLSAYAREYGCDRILVVCNLENAVTSDCLLRVD